MSDSTEAYLREWMHLIGRARAKDPVAILMFANAVASGADILRELTQDKQALELLREVARQRESWPVLKSPQPTIDTDHEKLFSLLQLGQNLLFPLDRHSKWKRDKFGKLVMDLWKSVIETGRLWRYFRDDPSCPPNMIVPLPKYAARAGKLLTFTIDNLEDWQWCACREFDRRYPRDNTDFERLARQLWGDQVPKRSPGGYIKTQIRQKVKWLLKT